MASLSAQQANALVTNVRRCDEPRATSDPDEDPRAPVARDILRFLMARGDHALFADRDDSEGPDAPYRATAFWPTGEKLYPMLRMAYGSSVMPCQSRLYFKRGELFAGQLWTGGSTSNLVMHPNMPTLASSGSEADWRSAWERLGVAPDVTHSMGNDSHYAKKVSSLACFRIQSLYGLIIICIDSVRVDAFNDKYITEFARRAESTKHFTAILELAASRGTQHLDFWSWSITRFMRSPLLLLGVVLVELFGREAVAEILNTAVRAATGPATTDPPGFWATATTLNLVAIAAAGFLGIPKRSLSVSHSGLSPQAVAWLLGVVGLHYLAVFGSRANDTAAHEGLILAIGCAVALCLLVGRFDSRLLATPTALVSILYAYVIVFALAQLRPHDSSLIALQLPAQVVLFAVVHWSLNAGVIERYLENLEAVATLSPRASPAVGLLGAVQMIRAYWREVVSP